MNIALLSEATIKITDSEPLAKLREGHSYWVRVVLDKRNTGALYAVAAVRCENRSEVHWLSDGVSNPSEAVKRMRSGFKTATHTQSVGHSVIQKLVSKGSAEILEGESANPFAS